LAASFSRSDASATGIAVLARNSSTSRLSCSGERCWTSTNAMPLSAGMAAKKVRNASSPPAEAPIPTTRRGSTGVGARGVRAVVLFDGLLLAMDFRWTNGKTGSMRHQASIGGPWVRNLPYEGRLSSGSDGTHHAMPPLSCPPNPRASAVAEGTQGIPCRPRSSDIALVTVCRLISAVDDGMNPDDLRRCP
jgi:hypothetical protein